MIAQQFVLADLGYSVFPIAPGGKNPLTAHGLLDATTNIEQIEAWTVQYPSANWGVRTDGLLVVDVDRTADAANPWLSDDPAKQLDLAAAPMVSTPRAGRHYWFRQPENSEYRNTQGVIAEKVDTRATGGYVLIPPSSVGGRSYEWIEGELELPLDKLPLPPQWLLDMLAKKPAAERSTYQAPGKITEGQRNNLLFRLACSLRRPGLTESEILAALEVANANRCDPPLDARDIARIAKSAARYEPAKANEAPTKFVPFPVNALPGPVGRFVREGARALGCDESFIALAILAALASGIGNSRRIRLKASWAEPCILWTALVGDSGTQKTPALSLAVEPLLTEQGHEMAAYDSRMTDYKTAKLRYDADLAAWKKKPNGLPPDEPVAPVPKRFVVSDITVEALAERLQDASRGLLAQRDELAGWLKGFDQYKKGQGGDAAHWLTLYNAKPLIVDRKTPVQKVTYVPMASVSVTGGIQLKTLRDALRQHWDNGLAARLLLAYPPKRKRQWTDATIDSDTNAEVCEVFRKLLSLDFQTDADGNAQPIDLPLTPDAEQVWIEFFNRHGAELFELSGNEAALWSKLEGTAPRLALIVHLVRWAARDATLTTPDAIDTVSMQAGITLADWFGAEGRRVYALLAEPDEATELAKLADYIAQRGGAITANQLTKGPKRYRGQSELADGDLMRIVDAGMAKWETVASELGGQPTRRCVLTNGSSVESAGESYELAA